MARLIFSILIASVVAFAAHAQTKAPGKQTKAATKEETKAPEAAAHSEQRMEDAIRLCIGCHGIPGYKTAFPVVYHVPKIAGQQPGYIVNALRAYKTGERSHPSMRGIAASLSEDDMKMLADHYGAPAK